MKRLSSRRSFFTKMKRKTMPKVIIITAHKVLLFVFVLYQTILRCRYRPSESLKLSETVFFESLVTLTLISRNPNPNLS